MQPLRGGSASPLEEEEGGGLAGSPLSSLPPCLGYCPNAPSWMRTDMWYAVAWLAMTNLRSSPGELSSFSPLPSRPSSAEVDPSPSTSNCRSACTSSFSEDEGQGKVATVKAKRKRAEVEGDGEEEGKEECSENAVAARRERGGLRQGAASQECAPRTKRGRKKKARRYAFHHRLNELECVAPQRMRDGRRTVQRKAASAPLWNFVEQNFGICDGRAVRKTGNGELLFKADVAKT